MPRQPRLDAPGILQHVMARGIERRLIFVDDPDRKDFLARFAQILEETQTQCYAWALIPNHFHLLIRTGQTPLSAVMRRLMTGYAVSFNHRHRRVGHLFQNRYKSVVCEENTYLLELIRYIHLNTLRAKLVSDMNALDVYPWTGHSTLMGNCKNPLIPGVATTQNSTPKTQNSHTDVPAPVLSLAEKTVDDVLRRFGETIEEARINYRDFVEKGIALGKRPEFQGGGLIRSMGGRKAAFIELKKGNVEKCDQRILGSGNFVNMTLEQSDKILEKKYLPKRPIEEVIEIVGQSLGISQSMICSGSRLKNISNARALVSYFAVEIVGHSLSDVARVLEVKRVSVREAVPKGKIIISNYPLMMSKII
jgi:REP element-mobilizing transposase RayT